MPRTCRLLFNGAIALAASMVACSTSTKKLSDGGQADTSQDLRADLASGNWTDVVSGVEAEGRAIDGRANSDNATDGRTRSEDVLAASDVRKELPELGPDLHSSDVPGITAGPLDGSAIDEMQKGAPEAGPDATQDVSASVSAQPDSSVDTSPGTEPSLLEGSTPYAGPVPAPGAVSVTMDGVVVTLNAYPGQIAVLFATPVPSAQEAQNAIQRYGGSALAQLPVVGAYLVAVDAGKEDAFLRQMSGDARIRMAVPNLVLEDQALDAATSGTLDAPGGTNPSVPATVAILEANCNPGKHAYEVATVLGANGAAVARCYDSDLGLLATDAGTIAVEDGGVPVVNQVSSLWRALNALMAATDPAGPGKPIFINMSYGAKGPAGDRCVPWNRPGSRPDVVAYEKASFSFWYAVVNTLVAAFKAHSQAQPWVAVTIAAGNSGVPLDARMDWLAQTLTRDGANVLDSNLMFVVQARHNLKVAARLEYVETWTAATTSVVATENGWAAYGTSFAAPYALAQAYYRFVNQLSARPADAVAFLKQAAGSDPNHVIPSPSGDQLSLPSSKSGELNLNPDTLFNCPAHSSWEPSRNACVFGYLNMTGQVVCPVGGIFAGVAGPWMTSVEWPSLQAQLGLGTSWIQIDPDTCRFDRTDTTTSTGTPVTQLTSGYVGCDCLLSPTSDVSCSGSLAPYLGERRDKITGVCYDWNTCGVSTAVGSGPAVQVNGYFASPIATRWPSLPAGVLCQIESVQICSGDSSGSCRPCSQ